MKMKESRRLSKSELKEIEEFEATNILQSGIVAGISAFGCLLYFTSSAVYDKNPSFVYIIGAMAIILFIGWAIFFMGYYFSKSVAPFRVRYLKMIDIDNKEDDEDV